MRTLAFAALLALHAVPLRAQFIEDPTMLDRGRLFAGDMYTHDAWDRYWEGTLERENGNVGSVTRQTNLWFANYGVTGRLNVIATVPYVWTEASQGVLQGQRGFQDLTLAAKYFLFDKPSTSFGLLRGIVVAVTAFPLTDYTPDFLPLSIGNQSKRLTGRFTFEAQSAGGWYLGGTTAYTQRGGITLDRPYYFTDGQLFLTDEVDMPEVFDYTASAGSRTRRLDAAFFFSQQQTLGGGDIRRQDAAFASNRMNFVKVGGRMMLPVPKLPSLIVAASYSYTIAGRNVGRAGVVTTGVFYSLPVLARSTP